MLAYVLLHCWALHADDQDNRFKRCYSAIVKHVHRVISWSCGWNLLIQRFWSRKMPPEDGSCFLQKTIGLDSRWFSGHFITFKTTLTNKLLSFFFPVNQVLKSSGIGVSNVLSFEERWDGMLRGLRQRLGQVGSAVGAPAEKQRQHKKKWWDEWYFRKEMRGDLG